MPEKCISNLRELPNRIMESQFGSLTFDPMTLSAKESNYGHRKKGVFIGEVSSTKPVPLPQSIEVFT
jgi:hypothetical protein